MGQLKPKQHAMRFKIKSRQKIKVNKLRQKYVEAKNNSEKQAVVEKALRVNPNLNKDSFLAPVKE